MTLIKIGVLLNLLWLGWEDWQKQSVPIWGLLSYAILSLLICSKEYLSFGLPFDNLLNYVFLVIQFALVFIVLRLFRPQTSIQKGIGKGDILFLLISALFWPYTIFIPAYFAGLLLGVVIAIYLAKGSPDRNMPIPLISALSLAFVFALGRAWW